MRPAKLVRMKECNASKPVAQRARAVNQSALTWDKRAGTGATLWMMPAHAVLFPGLSLNHAGDDKDEPSDNRAVYRDQGAVDKQLAQKIIALAFGRISHH